MSQAINMKAWQNRGSDRAKVIGKAGRGYDIEFSDGAVSRGCISQTAELEIGRWVTAVQTGEGGWQIVGDAANAPRGDFAPE